MCGIFFAYTISVETQLSFICRRLLGSKWLMPANSVIFEQNNASDLAQKLEAILLWSYDNKKEEGQKLMNYCQNKHSLVLLVSTLKSLYL